MFGGNSQQLYQIRLHDVETVFLMEPVILKGSFCNALDSFIHRNVSEKLRYIMRHQNVMFIDSHPMELDGVVIDGQGFQFLQSE